MGALIRLGNCFGVEKENKIGTANIDCMTLAVWYFFQIR
jgi:hypothetical protein